MYTAAVTVDMAEGRVYGRWECAGAAGTIRRDAAGFTADSPAVIQTGAARAYPTADEAARAAYAREIALAPELAIIRSKYRIDNAFRDPAVYAADPNDPRASFDGSPVPDGRYANLLPWERAAVKVARSHARLSVMVRDGDVVTLFAVAGGHTTIIRTENGAETGRWRVLDGCRKVALFLD